VANGNDPSGFIDKLAESYRHVRFGRGLVAKTGYATIALMTLWGIILWRLSENVWFDLALFVAGAIATAIYLWWVKGAQQFAKENPELALLEGAELLEYRRFEAQAKGFLSGGSTPLVIDPKAPKQIETDPHRADE